MKQPSARHNRDHTILGMLFGFALQCLTAVLAGWLLGLIIGIAAVFLMQPALINMYWFSLIKHELLDIQQYAPPWYGYMAERTLSRLQQILAVKAQWLADWKTGQTQTVWLKHYLQMSFTWLAGIPLITVLTTELTAVKVWRILAVAPLFLTLGTAAFLDGLAERDLRKWGFGRESALLYHRAKRYIAITWLTSIVIYLAVPLPTAFSWILLPAGLAYTLAVFLTARSFKKYL